MRGPYVILSPISKSHPFEERKIKVGPEDNPLKIGRAVARLKAAKDNAVFDCKVLSRNHAVLWHKDGEFFLKDTKSSNGTFVNDERLAVTGGESEIKHVNTGDIIQFGVEIVESTNKVTHGCIHAMVQLFDSDGQLIEAAPNTFIHNNEPGNCSTSMLNKHQLFQLQQYTSEAIFREESRQQKLDALQKILEEAEQRAESSWKQLVNDDILLTKIASLESQLAAYQKTATPDKLREELLQLSEDRTKFELNIKDIIRRLEDEKAETELKLGDAEKSLLMTEEECNRLKDEMKVLDSRLNEILPVFDFKQAELQTATQSLHELEKQRENLEAKLRTAEATVTKLEKETIMYSSVPYLAGRLVSLVKDEQKALDNEVSHKILEVLVARLLAQGQDLSYLLPTQNNSSPLEVSKTSSQAERLEICAAQTSSGEAMTNGEEITNGTGKENSSSEKPNGLQNGIHTESSPEKRENGIRNSAEKSTSPAKSDASDEAAAAEREQALRGEIETHLKENLELQARIKTCETELAEARSVIEAKENELRRQSASLDRLAALSAASASVAAAPALSAHSRSSSLSTPRSPAHISTVSAATPSGVSVIRQKDSTMQQALVLTLVPLLGLLLLLFSPVHRRLFAPHMHMPVAPSPSPSPGRSRPESPRLRSHTHRD